MLHPVTFGAHNWFYPIGNTPAINLASNLPPEQDARALLLGCGDARNILFTLFTEVHPCAPVGLARSGGPLFGNVLVPIREHFKHWWKAGTTESTDTSGFKANPTFTISKSANRFSVHHATNPLAGFHLATTFVPFETATSTSKTPFRDLKDFDPLVKAAKEEFRLWCQAFQSIQIDPTTQMSQVDMLCSTFDNAKGYDSNFPHQFNIIDISNLIDHLGVYNILLSVAPLLQDSFTSCLYTETLLTDQFNPKNGEQTLRELFGADPVWVFLLLGIAPADYLSGVTGISEAGESLLSIYGEKRPVHGRLMWKKLVPFHPNGTVGFDLPISLKAKFAYDIESMGDILVGVYDKLFEPEAEERLFPTHDENKEEKLSKTDQLEHDTRATFSLILHRLKGITSPTVDWEELMTKVFTVQLARNSSSLLVGGFHAEQQAWYHIFGVDTSSDLDLDPLERAKTMIIELSLEGVSLFNNEPKTLPVLTCLTIAVPIGIFRIQIMSNMKTYGAPPLKLTLHNPGLSQYFTSLRLCFGNLQHHKGSRSRETLDVLEGSPVYEEDVQGWYGSGDVLITCVVPTFFLLFKTCEIYLGLAQASPESMLIETPPPKNLVLFKTVIQDAQRVYLSTEFPHPGSLPPSRIFIASCQEPPSIHEPELDKENIPNQKRNLNFKIRESVIVKDAKSAGLKGGKSTPFPQTFNLTISKSPKPRITRISYRWSVDHDAELTMLLQTKAAISITKIGGWMATINLGSKSHRIVFPYRVGDAAKLAVARKSKYIELDAPVDTFNRHTIPEYVCLPVGISNACNPSVACYSLHRINPDASPPIIIDDMQKQDYKWLTTNLSSTLTESEQQYVLGSGPNKPYMDIKAQIYQMITEHRGLTDSHHSMFVLSDRIENKIHMPWYMMIYVKALRLDLSGNAVFADCAVLPLIEEELETVELLTELENINFMHAPGRNAKLWRQLSVSMVERCRTWRHDKDKCEYLKVKAMPLGAPELEAETLPLCSCGKGIFPDSFYGDPIMDNILPHCTRIVLGPLFLPTSSKEPARLEKVKEDIKKNRKVPTAPPKEAAPQAPPQSPPQAVPQVCVRCGKLGSEKSGLLNCPRCQNSRYCNQKCQKKDWEEHKLACYVPPK
ncbi:hypothetical protein Dda_1573 [Drechslerella dactyloides]|uniref:MYND-type domain-containing protein n=1 Tax=Drechslerella dactyloides TaxID=74499 RepID=A0AAD6J299_DREDA|nr:hypothetical protein Dda_1573 [Drechslerella dactyloides]